ncbi:MAG: polyphosphate kinase 2 [Parvularculaceae bacterium]
MSADFSFIKPVSISIDGEQREFDLNAPKLPAWIKDNTLSSGSYPYEKKMKQTKYEMKLAELQIELVKVQYWLKKTNNRLVLIFEGRDAAGKGGTIKTITSFLNPRAANVVALPKPTEREQGEWYYQRYIRHLPTAGEMTIFDRSWYNRAGVEPVMGFCTSAQHRHFLEETPRFEKMLVHDGIHVVKFWLNVGQEMQLKRFHDRRHNPLREWKLSPMDLKALTKWDDYTKARNQMLDQTHTDDAPWVILRTNDKRRARINAIRYLLRQLDYEGKDRDVIGDIDSNILGSGPNFLTGVGE